MHICFDCDEGTKCTGIKNTCVCTCMYSLDNFSWGESNTKKCNLPELNVLSRRTEGLMCQGKAFVLVTLTYTVITTPETMSAKCREDNARSSHSQCWCSCAAAWLQHRMVLR